jgi:hypothetical protein
MSDGPISSTVVLTISEKASTQKAGAGWGIWVVNYYKPGKSIACKLVAGEYWTDAATGEMRYKAKGMSARDLRACKEKWPQIMALLDNPPPLPAAAETETVPDEKVPDF